MTEPVPGDVRNVFLSFCLTKGLYAPALLVTSTEGIASLVFTQRYSNSKLAMEKAHAHAKMLYPGFQYQELMIGVKR